MLRRSDGGLQEPRKKNRGTGIGIVGENRRRTARIRNLLERCQTDIDDCASSAQKDEIARYTEDSQWSSVTGAGPERESG